MAYSYPNTNEYNSQGYSSTLKNSQGQYNQAGSHITSLQCSAVRQNINSDHMLGASQVSWLDKIEEQHEHIYDHSGLKTNTNGPNDKPINQMKFSFNANQQHPSESAAKRSSDRNNRQQSLKDIYYQEFYKQTSRIKDVQEARKAMLDNLQKKQRGKKNTSNKENLVGSIRRFTQDEMTKTNLKGKFQYTTQNQFKKTQQERGTRDEQQLSLKYLQQSLAKKDVVRVPLSKLTYLQESEANKETSTSKVATASVNVKQFEEGDAQLDFKLGILFEQLDGRKFGKISRQNCQYENLNDELKIGFGQIFVQVIFKELVLNKLDFVQLAQKVLKGINSLHFYSIVRAISIKMNASEENVTRKTQRLGETIKRNNTYSVKYNCQSKMSNPQFQTYQLKQTQAFIPQAIYPPKSYNPAPTFRQKPQEQYGATFMSHPKELSSRIKSQLHKLQPSSNNEAEEMLAKYNMSYLNLQKNQQLCKQYLLSLHNGHALADIPPAIRKKIRNISEEMIREHRHNLQILIKLNSLMENCLSVSRRKIESFSCEKYQTAGQSSLGTQRLKNLEWASAVY